MQRIISLTHPFARKARIVMVENLSYLMTHAVKLAERPLFIDTILPVSSVVVAAAWRFPRPVFYRLLEPPAGFIVTKTGFCF